MSGHSRLTATTTRRETSPGVEKGQPDPFGVDELVRRFVVWLDHFGEQSHDPYDLWATGVGRRAKRLYYRRPTVGAVAAAPFVLLDTFVPSLRNLVSVARRSPMADAHFALGFFALSRAAFSDDAVVARGERFLEQLTRTRCPGFRECCWGLPFDWESRAGTILAGTPLMTVVPYVYEAFEAGYETTGNQYYLETMESIARFVHQEIPVTDLGDGGAAAAYSPHDRTRVVNASAYRAYVLMAAGRRFERPEWSDEAVRNVRFVLGSQRSDGSWPYGTAPGDDFVDNFHTCFVLKNLFKLWRISGRADVRASVRHGYAFYRRRLLDERTQPIPFAAQPRFTLHRRDLYDYAEGITLSHLLLEVEPTAREVLRALVAALRDEWVLPDGHFVTRKLVVGRNKVPYHRWGQAQTFHALAELRAVES